MGFHHRIVISTDQREWRDPRIYKLILSEHRESKDLRLHRHETSLSIPVRSKIREFATLNVVQNAPMTLSSIAHVGKMLIPRGAVRLVTEAIDIDISLPADEDANVLSIRFVGIFLA